MHWNLLVTHVVLMSMLRTFQVSTIIFKSHSQRGEYNCKYEAVIFNLTLPSEMSCAFKCQIRKGCKSFDFKEESCIGCKDNCDMNRSPSESSTGQCWKRKESSSDCQSYLNRIGYMTGGVFRIKSVNGNVYDVFCLRHWDTEIIWTVFLRRINETLEFNRTFVDYRDGFGDVHGNHWRGLEFLHRMTTEKSTELLFVIDEKVPHSETSTRTTYEVFTNFSVGPAPGYKLSVGELSRGGSSKLSLDESKPRGTKTRLCFTYSNNNNFSTMDRDKSGSSCSSKFGYGGWWWNRDCLSLNPTGSNMETAVTASQCGGYKLVKELMMAFRTIN